MCVVKLARKCEIEHWLPCVADGRAGGVRLHDYLNFLGRVDLLTHGAPQARFARQNSTVNTTSNNQRLRSAGDNDRRSKRFCSSAVLCVSFT